MTKLAALFCLIFLYGLSAHAQDNLKNDTIFVYASGFAKIKFPADINRVIVDDRNKSYDPLIFHNDLTLTKKSDKPQNPDGFTVYEGGQRNMREHNFVLIYLPEQRNRNESLYDYSSLKKIKERVKYLKEAEAANKEAAAINRNPAPVKTGVLPAVSNTKQDDTGSMVLDAQGNLHIGEQIISREQFSKDVHNLLDNFDAYVQELYNHKHHTTVELDTITKYTLRLFKDSALIEVSSLSREEPTPYSVRQYCDRLRYSTKFEHVTMTAHTLAFISQLQPQMDGSYVGTVTRELSFVGYGPDKQVRYRDKTVKSYNIVFTSYKVFKNGEYVKEWEMKIADISVTHTTQ